MACHDSNHIHSWFNGNMRIWEAKEVCGNMEVTNFLLTCFKILVLFNQFFTCDKTMNAWNGPYVRDIYVSRRLPMTQLSKKKHGNLRKD